MSVLNPNQTGLTPQQKMVSLLSSMGITDFSKAQGVTKTIFDTAEFTSTITDQKVSFFDQNRGLPQTNFPGRFGVMEAMVIQSISIVGYNNNGEFDFGKFLGSDETYYSITIGRDVVCENFPITGAKISSENSADGSTTFTMDFNSLLVLPPDTDFKVELYNADVVVPPDGFGKIRVMLSGTGIELNQKF